MEKDIKKMEKTVRENIKALNKLTGKTYELFDKEDMIKGILKDHKRCGELVESK